MNIKLKTILESETQPLVEQVVEPSEQILKGFSKVLKMKTGINAQFALTKTTPNVLYYEADASNEIKTPIMKALFQTLTIDVAVTQIPNVIGGYAFRISINYTHPQGGSNGKDIGTILFQNNKFTTRLY